jgi:transcriptional regulator with XRE-family HTH domain
MVSGVDPSALRAAREKAGLTQHELARLVGAAGGERVSRWELGTSEPRPEFIAKLAHTLGLPASRLIRFEGEGPDLRALRLQAGLTVSELATRTNLSVPTYLRWESGRWARLPSPAVLEAIARALDESVDVVAAGFRAAQRPREVRQLRDN